MKPIDIPFPLSTAPGVRLQESAGRLINAYAEPLGPTAPSKAVYRRSPGLSNFGTTNRSGYRGMIEINGVLYSAFSGQLEKHASAGGASTNVGALVGTKKGFFARNNKFPTPDQVFVDPDGNIATFTSSAVTGGYPDADLPAVIAVTSINGYFVFVTADGRAFASDLNSTAINALSFGSANSKPDGLVRPVSYGGMLFLMGSSTTEVWTDQGLSPFPFSRNVVIPRGLAGPYCVAGQEDSFGKALIWVADDNTVVSLNGYTPEKISPPDLDALIQAVSDTSTLSAKVYVSRGHAFWELSSDTWTWVYNLNNQKWHERAKHLGARSRISGNSCYAFGKWLCGDVDTGNIQQITGDAQEDISSPLRWRIESGPVTGFPNGQFVGRADFFFETGVGVATGEDPVETDPTVEIAWSDDGGLTWSAPLQRKLGRQATSRQMVSLVACTGRAGWQGRRWRLDISSPVPVGFFGGRQSADPRVT